MDTQTSKTRVEALATSLGYNSCFAVASSGQSGCLCLFWNKEIKLEVLDYSQYHIDTRVEVLSSVVWRVTLSTERYKSDCKI